MKEEMRNGFLKFLPRGPDLASPEMNRAAETGAAAVESHLYLYFNTQTGEKDEDRNLHLHTRIGPRGT
jgi:hypothetical protein